MAATATVTTFWNVFVTALLRCVAALGFGVRPEQRPEPKAAAAPDVIRGAARVAIPAPRSFEPRRDRSRPPTMKQRIRAEAHGSSPSARSLPDDLADLADGADSAGIAGIADTGPAASAALA